MNWLRRAVGAVAGRVARWGGASVKASYDAAATTSENTKHWSKADDLSAASANSPEVRRILRSRSRYERANNGYIGGMVRRIAYHIVGPTGPRLGVTTGDEAADRQIEAAWLSWCRAVKLPRKLRCLAQAYIGDGEGIGLFVTDPDLAHSVKLELRLYEADQMSTPGLALTRVDGVDGIELNPAGKPTAYHFLRSHPGDAIGWVMDYDRVPARSVVHWFRLDRPGQYRGVPHITPGLPLGAQLRRYTLAVLTAAETAANVAAYFETDNDADESETAAEEYSTMPIERGSIMQLPAKTKINQLKAEQPTTTYQQFKSELLKEIGSATDTPFNVVACDSSPYNYSSARLDHLLFRAAVLCERADCESEVLEPLFAAWLEEAVMVPGLLPPGTTPARVPHEWYWSGFPSIDPQKEAAADTERLNNGTTTLKELLAEYGQDWRTFLVQRGREIALADSLGVPYPTPGGAAQASAPAAPEQPAEEPQGATP